MFELVAKDFAVPTGLEHPRFTLRQLTIDDVVRDFDAICDRVDHEGAPQPPFVNTIAANLVDLGWHQKEFELRRSFAYTVVAPDESQVLGCVYINPSRTHDAGIRLWVRRSAYAQGLDEMLEAAVREWIGGAWPFSRVTFEERDR